jgi:hypothetical protein
MTFSPRAIEAAARALYEQSSGRTDWDDAAAVDKQYADGLELLPKGYWRDQARVALSAALAVDGLALVPVEPSAEMLCAAVPFPLLLVKERNDPQYTKNMEAACLVERAVARQVYRTMLAAASDREERRPPPKEKP